MSSIQLFTFGDFQENTYVLSDAASRQCVLIDPGCFYDAEKKALQTFIETNELTPVRLLNTHCHLDHVFGNRFVAETYNLLPETHEGEVPVLEAVQRVCDAYGIRGYEASPEIGNFLTTDDVIEFGDTKLEILFVPGHSPAHIAFFNRAENYVIGGDVLFHRSIGRTDLPGGDFDTLANSIRTQFYTLPDQVEIYPGHGPKTTVGSEKIHNPFVKG